ncbi:hypothetical protein [Pseudoxanthomonas suwonensis]|uniref:hypothetical protein n=1 Tax=Pseudoxanthomonas suwonensis TaxID=314722 RepID=UPI001186D5DD|nr:hypothetical protein [Pseudoxanthomonas suwonensis]
MVLIISIGLFLAVLAVIVFTLRKRNLGRKSIFDTYFSSARTAADEGERAYRAQIKNLGGTPTVRGVALARIATTLFPVAAYAIAETNNLIPESIKKFSPVSGKDVWGLASGVALEPIGDIRGTTYFKEVRDDHHYAIDQFVNFINSTDIFSPHEAIESALQHLSPIWIRAIELSDSNESPRVNGYANQYVTSGMTQLMDVFKLLAAPNS